MNIVSSQRVGRGDKGIKALSVAGHFVYEGFHIVAGHAREDKFPQPGGPHARRVFLIVANEAEIAWINSAGENQDYGQIITTPLWLLVGGIDMFDG
ncbi:hypothetical protein PCASD_22210 [Puccinia coronata f. sp. avenae]|uniref:Uncharacterized protein n=1 Tax=Puccinia coronata f. sp. avenae TaxID=200324 RepID=A0A2N5T7U1_9BASI|nr:hypothetical protein PCASD_22210 [Puccinia coronata f. sp. avenae]